MPSACASLLSVVYVSPFGPGIPMETSSDSVQESPASVAALRSVIDQAIRNRQVLRLNVRLYSRRIEPYFLATNLDGDLVLICWQLSGGCDSGHPVGWKEFKVADIS